MEAQEEPRVQVNQQDPFYKAAPRNLPNSTTILVLGILSILLCWWHLVSFAGIVLGLISLIKAKRELSVYHANPSAFTLSSLNNVKTGRICAIIGLSISVIIFLFVILLILGILASLPFWGMMNQ
jgi:hypothetical protein